MQKTFKFSFIILLTFLTAFAVYSQKVPTNDELAKVEKLFKEGNKLSIQNKPTEALAKYEKTIEIVSDSKGLLYNAGLVSFQLNSFDKAAKYWSKLKSIDPNDWQVRAKLVQTYQSLRNLDKRYFERKELFDLRKTNKILELNKTDFYCREQSIMGTEKVMVFEYFELKGGRALRYVFYILDENDKPKYRISLGSYELTNSIWRETKKPKLKKEERLFHLDGYFDGGHATYGMCAKEPTYDETRKIVEGIVVKKNTPISLTVKKSKKLRRKTP